LGAGFIFPGPINSDVGIKYIFHGSASMLFNQCTEYFPICLYLEKGMADGS